MAEEDGKEREAGGPTREKEGTPGRGARRSPVPVCLFHLHPHCLTLQFRVCHLPFSLCPWSVRIPRPPPSSPHCAGAFPSSVYWELARSRILRS